MDTFNLDDKQLLPIGNTIHGAAVRSCHIENRVPLNQGGCGDKAMGDLVLTTLEGHVISTPLFIKKFSWKGRSEATYYRHLTQCAVPTPRLYGAIMHPDGDEILLLERLPQIGFDRTNEAEWRQLLTLLARFNTCEVTPNYLPHLHTYEQGGRIGGWWITGFSPFPPAVEEIEANLRTCGVGAGDLADLSLAALRLCDHVAAQPAGLVHQDFLADNLGWRGDRADYVCIVPGARSGRYVDSRSEDQAQIPCGSSTGCAPMAGYNRKSNSLSVLEQREGVSRLELDFDGLVFVCAIL